MGVALQTHVTPSFRHNFLLTKDNEGVVSASKQRSQMDTLTFTGENGSGVATFHAARGCRSVKLSLAL